MPRFQPGRSGNPKGRPKGSRNRAKELADLVDKGELIDLALTAARAGDVSAIKLLLDRTLPPLRPTAQYIEVRNVAPGSTLADQGQAVLACMYDGQMPPDLATVLLKALTEQSRLVEHVELLARIEALEAAA